MYINERINLERIQTGYIHVDYDLIYIYNKNRYVQK